MNAERDRDMRRGRGDDRTEDWTDGRTGAQNAGSGHGCDDTELDAGDFSAWIQQVQEAIGGQHGSDVPCDGCTACCTASQFVPIEPDEAETLAHIPAELLFPAPRRPRGHLLLGYDERGHCPMLVDGGCSIYEHRPRACRTYDCRVLPAAGVAIDGEPGKAAIGRRVGRWRFSYPTQADRAQHEAVRTAAAFLRQHDGELPEGAVPATATGLAVLAIELHGLFLDRNTESGRTSVVAPAPSVVRVELARRSRPGA
jgi:hypothetical protein